jgi:hypothetical protein
MKKMLHVQNGRTGEAEAGVCPPAAVPATYDLRLVLDKCIISNLNPDSNHEQMLHVQNGRMGASSAGVGPPTAVPVDLFGDLQDTPVAANAPPAPAVQAQEPAATSQNPFMQDLR